VDDEATIVLMYPKAQGIIQASWNWPFDRKDMEIYGQTGHLLVPRNVRREIKPSGLSSLEVNMIVTEILDAARESARTGNRIELK
jgi:hypothetical protein